jgi:hypothetical protein
MMSFTGRFQTLKVFLDALRIVFCFLKVAWHVNDLKSEFRDFRGSMVAGWVR